MKLFLLIALTAFTLAAQSVFVLLPNGRWDFFRLGPNMTANIPARTLDCVVPALPGVKVYNFVADGVQAVFSLPSGDPVPKELLVFNYFPLDGSGTPTPLYTRVGRVITLNLPQGPPVTGSLVQIVAFW